MVVLWIARFAALFEPSTAAKAATEFAGIVGAALGAYGAYRCRSVQRSGFCGQQVTMVKHKERNNMPAHCLPSNTILCTVALTSTGFDAFCPRVLEI